MAEQMTHWERVRSALAGDDVDRPPTSVWRHFYGHETSAHGLAESMLEFQRRFDWDFVKVNPRASYHSEDWGVKLRFSGSDSQGHQILDWPVRQAPDWEAIRPLDVRDGVLGEHLDALGRIVQGVGEQVPILMTVFTPLSVAAQLAGSEEAMVALLHEQPDAVHGALAAIAETFVAFGRECLSTGASGLFFATTSWATYDQLTDEEYSEFGRPYDLEVLQALPEAEFHVLHVCGSNNMLPALADYPVAAFNWDSQDETNVWLKQGAKITGKAVIGGISHSTTLAEGSPEEVAGEALWTLDLMEGTRWMFGPGCTYGARVPDANIRALRDAFAGR